MSGQGATPAAKSETKESNGEAKAPAAMAALTTPAETSTATETAKTVEQPASTPAIPTEKSATNGEYTTLAGAKLAADTSNPSHPTSPTITTAAAEADPEHVRNASPNSSLPETSRAGTYTVPYRDTEVASPPVDSRQGTSATRFEQQGGTHAEGQLEHSTPNTQVDGQGVSHTVVEPRTVGQAPKETPLYHEDDGEAKPGMMEQAQTLAGQAVESVQGIPAAVMGAVGLGGAAEKEEEPVKEEKKEDPRVDELDDRIVEEFVRDRAMTKQQVK